MHAEEIKAAMRMSGVPQAMLAADLNVSRGAISQVISGASKSARLQAAISAVTGHPIDVLWPNQVRLRKAAA